MEQHGESAPDRAEEGDLPRSGQEVSELREGLDESGDGGRSGGAGPDRLGGERDDGQSPTSDHPESPSEALTGPGGGSAHHNDVRRTELEGEAQEGLGGATAGQLPHSTHLPGVEGGVRGRGGRRVDEEHPWVTAWWAWFEHRGGSR